MNKKKPPSTALILDVYDAFLRSVNEGEAARALGLYPKVLEKRLHSHPELRLARERALAKKAKQPETFSQYVFKCLSPEAQKVWDQMQFWDGHKTAHERINHILNGQATKVHQEIFIHALVTSNYATSEALRKACLPISKFQSWVKHDPEFRMLVDEIGIHKKNFFEEALMDLVAMRHPAVVIHVNKTVNADRGYGDRVALDVNSTTTKQVGDFNLEDLDLPIEIKVKVLEAIRAKKEQLALPAPQNGKVIEV